MAKTTKITDDMRADVVCAQNADKIAEWDAITEAREREAAS